MRNHKLYRTNKSLEKRILLKFCTGPRIGGSLQVNGRNEIDFQGIYANGAQDFLLLLFKTVNVVLSEKGAY